MKFIPALPVLALSFLGTGAFAASGATVTNMDTKPHILVIELEDESTKELTIGAGATLQNVCGECYLGLKGSDDVEYVDMAMTFTIKDGQLIYQSSGN